MADYHIRLATDEDLDHLAAIEGDGDRRYEPQPEFGGMENLPNLSADAYRQLPADATIWIAHLEKPLGFIYAYDMDDDLYIGQLSVTLAAQNKGIGQALLMKIVDIAQERQKRGVVLTTYRDVSWNAPFYARRGFKILLRAEMGPQLREHAREDDEKWSQFSPRVVMGHLF
jgi:GNAT superfamily N-acetyltransferase